MITAGLDGFVEGRLSGFDKQLGVWGGDTVNILSLSENIGDSLIGCGEMFSGIALRKGGQRTDAEVCVVEVLAASSERGLALPRYGYPRRRTSCQVALGCTALLPQRYRVPARRRVVHTLTEAKCRGPGVCRSISILITARDALRSAKGSFEPVGGSPIPKMPTNVSSRSARATDVASEGGRSSPANRG